MRYVLLLLMTLASASVQASPEPIKQVEAFMAAFNAHDSERMADYVTDDVQWLSVNGAEIAVETSGKQALLEAMKGYFESCSSCQSRLIKLSASGSRVSTIEEASWLRNGQRRAQQSIAIYEFSNHLIRRVYYFPAD
ncbi:hypothetical protein PSI9734_01760 [Pseudidiomarina piscicola]|uniref:SnoaL-like domain-containing protein n=1 Tax=Pseudidiomarina piscicola TaxID=2614830 RepID=A0A6S6WNA7_9GAMM|nr:nuclear transport factor 2 family protein [Pseudidiomarina piscicola]CAB0151371.1 hypothetical protein PSI9734_01760 [Pseudidiomarina piscicola]VZT40852.1 hypothetical protein PSI9734_01760 [Pseudomonas aeruginosa]